jgi:hypothetical protein
MQQPTRYYITKSGEEPTVRSVRVEQLEVPVALDETRQNARVDNPSVEASAEVRRTVKDLVQEAIHKRHFFS